MAGLGWGVQARQGVLTGRRGHGGLRLRAQGRFLVGGGVQAGQRVLARSGGGRRRGRGDRRAGRHGPVPPLRRAGQRGRDPAGVRTDLGGRAGVLQHLLDGLTCRLTGGHPGRHHAGHQGRRERRAAPPGVPVGHVGRAEPAARQVREGALEIGADGRRVDPRAAVGERRRLAALGERADRDHPLRGGRPERATVDARVARGGDHHRGVGQAGQGLGQDRAELVAEGVSPGRDQHHVRTALLGVTDRVQGGRELHLVAEPGLVQHATEDDPGVGANAQHQAGGERAVAGQSAVRELRQVERRLGVGRIQIDVVRGAPEPAVQDPARVEHSHPGTRVAAPARHRRRHERDRAGQRRLAARVAGLTAEHVVRRGEGLPVPVGDRADHGQGIRVRGQV